MNIPIYTNYKNRLQAETEFLNIQASTMRDDAKRKNELFSKQIDNINAMSKPQMTLNDELYGNNGKALEVWDKQHNEIRSLSRKAFTQSPAAQSLIGRFVDMVYGARLELQASPLWSIIPKAPTKLEEKQKIIKNIETRYILWAKTKKSDYNEDKNHYQRSRQNFEKLMLDGEYFTILRYSQSRKRNPLSIQYVAPENIMRVSSQIQTGNTESDGIEYNSKGVAVAYHVYSPITGKSIRVAKYSIKTGRTFVIHNKIGNGRRGISILAGIITEITKLADFQALEIQAAVINAMFAVWIETGIGGENKPITTEKSLGQRNTTPEIASRVNTSDVQANLNSMQFSKGGNIVQGMGEGQKLHSFDTKRPNANFEQFYKTTIRSLLSAKGMPYDVAMYDPEASYSAIRSNLLLFWNRVMTLRFDHSTDYEDVIYRMWLYGEIENNNIAVNGWENDTIQDAFSNATWTGPSRPDIDPYKSAKANEIEVNNSWKTNSIISAERGGGDFDENVSRTFSENIEKAKANEPIIIQEKTNYSESKSTSIVEDK